MGKVKEFIISSLFVVAVLLGAGWWWYGEIRKEILDGVRAQLEGFQKELDRKNKEAIQQAFDEHEAILSGYQVIVRGNLTEYERRRLSECPPKGSQASCAKLELWYRTALAGAMEDAKRRSKGKK